jgi:hypothetical protein
VSCALTKCARRMCRCRLVTSPAARRHALLVLLRSLRRRPQRQHQRRVHHQPVPHRQRTHRSSWQTIACSCGSKQATRSCSCARRRLLSPIAGACVFVVCGVVECGRIAHSGNHTTATSSPSLERASSASGSVFNSALASLAYLAPTPGNLRMLQVCAYTLLVSRACVTICISRV